MATHSSVSAWRLPWTEEPGGLQSMGLQNSGHDLEHTRGRGGKWGLVTTSVFNMRSCKDMKLSSPPSHPLPKEHEGRR